MYHLIADRNYLYLETKFKSHERKIAECYKLLHLNPFDERLKTRKAEGYSGYYRSKITNKFFLDWKLSNNKIYLVRLFEVQS